MEIELENEAREIALRARALDGIELSSVLLWDMSITRGTASDLAPGAVSESATYRAERSQENLFLEIGSTFEISNASNEKIADIQISHLVGFLVPEERAFNDDEVEVVLSQARLAAYPFTRQQLLTLSADMGIEPVLMPLMRRSNMGPALPKP